MSQLTARVCVAHAEADCAGHAYVLVVCVSPKHE